MPYQKLALIIVSVALVLGLSTAPAQSSESSEIYRLEQGSTFQQGCFPPCLCPLQQKANVRGTFNVTRAGFDGLFNHYDITDVNWTVSLGHPELRITGSGKYRIGGEFALMHRLELELKVGDGVVQHFDSGLLLGGSGFPSIQITVSINRQFCFDRVIVLNAVPVRSDEIQHYVLAPETTLETGCFDPCLCILPNVFRPVVGGFALVPIAESPLFTEFAVANVKWEAGAPKPPIGPPSIEITGFGTYRIGGEFAVQHQLTLDLSFDGGELRHFDSDLVIGGSSYPAIDIVISMNRMVCFDQVFDIHAVPVPFEPVDLNGPG